ncbi:MAG: hypothetical protein AB7D46_10795 [Flavobacteriaceae bacterium]|uniref:Uncharacterized protein n=1 Tax=Chryseobacterium taichungense TaxID=295069 RepID=A0A1H8A2I8_9FLAO|nr:hypothetical protein [Chryseobacterium taichungense]SEM64801.1 hypothetical protein SAMN05421856_10559 [Chryseobacterium taichungense]
MESLAYLIVWIWAISTVGISLYNLARAYFALTPVVIHFTCKEQFEWYDGLNRNSAIIITFYSLLSLFIALTYGVSVIKYNDWFNILVNLFLNIIIQIGLMLIIENKMPYTIIQTCKNFFNQGFDYYPLSRIQEKKINVADKTFEILDTIKTTVTSSNTKIENLIQHYSVIETPFAPKKSTVSTQKIIEKYKINPISINDVEVLIKGRIPKQPIIFTQVYSGKINKKIIFRFFQDNFELIDNDTKDWKTGQNAILEFINKYSSFETAQTDYLELNKGNFSLTADILSRYKDKI